MSGRPFAFGSAIGEAWGPVRGLYGSTLGPQVDAVRKYGGEIGAQQFYRSVNSRVNPENRDTAFSRGLPQWFKDYIRRASGQDRTQR